MTAGFAETGPAGPGDVPGPATEPVRPAPQPPPSRPPNPIGNVIDNTRGLGDAVPPPLQPLTQNLLELLLAPIAPHTRR